MRIGQQLDIRIR